MNARPHVISFYHSLAPGLVMVSRMGIWVVSIVSLSLSAYGSQIFHAASSWADPKVRAVLSQTLTWTKYIPWSHAQLSDTRIVVVINAGSSLHDDLQRMKPADSQKFSFNALPCLRNGIQGSCSVLMNLQISWEKKGDSKPQPWLE